MDERLTKKAGNYARKRRRRKSWHKVVTAMAAVVVFCTTYALILPAITEEKVPTCGMEEHQHEEACYEQTAKILSCVCEIHSHGPECLDELGHVICGQDRYLVHNHDEYCYDETGELVCALPENAVHIHTEECYAVSEGVPETQPETVPETQPAHIHGEDCYETVPGQLICTEEEYTGHLHSEEAGCYTYETVQICTQEESEGHQHGDACYDPEGLLICTEEERPGHYHDETCVEQTAVLICTLEEDPGHQHDETCYEEDQQVLICEIPEEIPEETQNVPQEETQEQPKEETQEQPAPVLICGYGVPVQHQHTEDCFQPAEGEAPVLICEQEEHTHDDLRCYADLTADLETESDWVQTLPALSGEWEQDIVAIASSQLGYMESTRNYIVEENDEVKGYTRFGQWYGYPYGDWCAMFASFCLDYAQVPADMVPQEANCQNWVELLRAKALFLPAGECIGAEGECLAAAGDLVFFDHNGDGIANHVGLVEYVEEGLLHTIEGNVSNSVRRMKYELTDPEILGYGLLPEQPGETDPTEPEVPLTEQTIQAVIYTDASLEQPAEDETLILITGLLPEGARAVAFPVELEEDLIQGETVILAYDITIVDGEGNPIVQSESQDPFQVSIQPPGWEPSEDTNYNVYYIPEEGDPQIVESESEEDIVTFNTDHFSTYALTATGTLNTIYLNGATGDDANSGATTNAAVKTLDRALALVKEGGTVYITGTVTVSDTAQWDLESSVTVKRYSSFTGPLITVANGGSLTLKNITINGGSGTPSSSNIATNSTFASGSAKAPLIVVQSGGRLNVSAGAVLEYNSNVPNSSNNKFSESGYIGLGGAVYCNGTLTMTGGLIQYCEAQCGGGVYVENGSFYLSGGTIDHNYARDIVSYRNRVENYHKNAGGGVYVGDNAIMTMTGGTVSNNQSSREGGGISLGWLNRSNNSGIGSYLTTFTMNGGSITGNYAVSTGGGLNITAGRQAFINAGYITYNKADGKEYQDSKSYVSSGNYCQVFSGGGIYIDAKQWTTYPNDDYGVPGKAVINRVLISKNTATNSGGGIASCVTSVNFVYGNNTNGTAIYDNNSNELYVSQGSLNLGDTVLGGGAYNWSKSGSTYTNKLTDNSAAIVKAKELATVFIENNTAYLGGGIGCNGLIEIGGEEEESTYINIEKKWEDDGLTAHPEYIEVQILQNGKPYGAPVRIYRSVDISGNEVWPAFYVGGLPSGYTYTIVEIEVPGYEASISQNGKDFVITNTPTGFKVVKKWVDDTESDRPTEIVVQLYQDGEPYGESVKLTAANGWKYTWLNLPEGHQYTARELEIPDGYYTADDGQLIDPDTWQITNTKIPLTSVSVEKRWEGGGPLDSATAFLVSNGVKIGEAVLSAENGWFHRWDNLPALNNRGEEITYWVEEQAVSGFASSIERGELPDKTTYVWQAVSSMESGKSYLLVSSSGALALNGSSLTWSGVSDILDSGENAETSELWKMNNGKLQNGGGRYLYFYYSNWSYSFQTTTYINSANAKWSDGKISGTYSSTTRYFSGINSSGYGSASSNTSGAITFTAYERVERTEKGSDLHYIVTNTKLPDSIRFRFGKYAVGASKEPTLLAGAHLELYQVSDAGDVTIPGTDVKGVLVDSWISENVSGTDGGIHVKNLFSGTYYLIETQVPGGHIGLSGPIVFEVAAESGTVNLVACPYELTLSGGSEVELPIYNSVSYVLPDTGGMGTGLYTAGGLLLMITSAVLLFLPHGKRRRGSHDHL